MSRTQPFGHAILSVESSKNIGVYQESCKGGQDDDDPQGRL